MPATYSIGEGIPLLGYYTTAGGVFVTSGVANQVVECAWIDPTARELIISIRSGVAPGGGGPYALSGEFFFQW
jgi:hypothetical protein